MHPLYAFDANLPGMLVHAQSIFTQDELEKLKPFSQQLVPAYAGDEGAKQTLKQWGIYITGNLVFDYANWIISRLFKMPVPSGRVSTKGSGIDPSGRTVCVRARFWSPNTSFENLRLSEPKAYFDYFLGVFFKDRESFDLHGVVYAPYNVICTLCKPDSDKPTMWSIRWSDKSEDLVRLYWASPKSTDRV